MIGCVSAIDSSGWSDADVGYETFKIPPNMKIPTAAILTCMNMTKTLMYSPSGM